jgi:hypothetical protein
MNGRRRWVLLFVLAQGLVVSASASSGGGGKPGPDEGPAVAGTLVTNNISIESKPGAVRATPTSSTSAKDSPGTSLTGYTIVSNGPLSNPNGVQSFGDVSCPTGTVAYGGGVVGQSDGLFQDVNGSFPLVSGGVATGWRDYVDNDSGSDSSFTVYAVCAKKSKNYGVVSAEFSNPIGLQSSGSVTCPLTPRGKVMKPFGGGGIGTSFGLFQNINSSLPRTSPRGWRVDMNNASGANEDFRVYAVCGTKRGWIVSAGNPVTQSAFSQTAADASCPSGKVDVGGGVFSSSGSTHVNLNTTFPPTTLIWRSFENNDTSGNPTITPYVVCLSP